MPVQDDRDLQMHLKKLSIFSPKISLWFDFQRAAGSEVVEETDMTEVTKRKKTSPPEPT